MSRKSSFIIIYAVIFLCFGCSNPHNNYTLPTVNVKEDQVPDLDPEKVANVHLKFSQIADNIKMVKLQSLDSSLISAHSAFLVGDKYILAKYKNEVYQFSDKGEFIRLITKEGRGPGEIPTIRSNFQFNMDEKSDMLFVSAADKIYLFKLSDGGFLGTKEQKIPNDKTEAGSVVFTPDSLFIISYSSRGGLPDDSLGCGIVVQDWNNNLLFKKSFDFKTWSVFPDPINYEMLHGSSISVVKTNDSNEYIIQVNNQDSSYVFDLKNFSLKPYLLLRTKGPLKGKYPIDYISVGSYKTSPEFNRSNGYHFMIMDVVSNLNGFPDSINGYSYQIFYDSNNKTAFNIDPFEDDYLGFQHPRKGPVSSQCIFPSLVAPEGKVVVVYDAAEILKFLNEKLKDKDIKGEVLDRLTNLSSDITEFSNPILLIGDMKKNVVLN